MRVTELRATARAACDYVHAREWYLRYRLVVLLVLYLPVGWKHQGVEEFVSYLGMALIASFIVEYQLEVPELARVSLVFRRALLGFIIGALFALVILCEWAVLTHRELWWWLVLDLCAGLFVGSLCSYKLLQAHHRLDLQDALQDALK